MPVVQDLLEGQGIFAQISSRALRVLIIWSSWSSLAGQDEGESHKAARAGQGRAWQGSQHQQDMQSPTLPPLCVHTAARPCASLSPAMGAMTLTGKLSAR